MSGEPKQDNRPLAPEEWVTYNQDGLATWHNADFLKEERFARAYDLGKATGSWGGVDPCWRVYLACWAAQHALGLAGDFVECGVNRGGLARAIVDYVDFCGSGKTFHLVDTFSGIPPDVFLEEEIAFGLPQRYAHYDECYEEVRRTFAPFPNVKLHRGRVPDVLPQVQARGVAFLSIDMNNALSEIAAAEFFWEQLTPGAMVVLDDYAQQPHRLQKAAFDEFARRRNTSVLCLPTGQGLMVKR